MWSAKTKRWVGGIGLSLLVLTAILLLSNREELELIYCQRQTLAAYQGLQTRHRAQLEFFETHGQYARSLGELEQASEDGDYRYRLQSVSDFGFLLRADSISDTQTMDENGILDHLRDGCAKSP